MRNIDPILNERLEFLISSMGWELVGCEKLPMGGQTLLRIYIDKPEGSKASLTINACSMVSQQVGAMIEVEELMPGRYILEVSSPGIDRPLFKLEHFLKCVGKQVKIKLYTPLDSRRQFKGILQQVVNEDIYMSIDDTDLIIKIAFSEIERANLVGEVLFSKKKKGRNRK